MAFSDESLAERLSSKLEFKKALSVSCYFSFQINHLPITESLDVHFSKSSLATV